MLSCSCHLLGRDIDRAAFRCQHSLPPTAPHSRWHAGGGTMKYAPTQWHRGSPKVGELVLYGETSSSSLPRVFTPNCAMIAATIRKPPISKNEGSTPMRGRIGVRA